MIYSVVRGNLFSVGKDYIAHCISSDIAMGKGIAVDVQKYYKVKNTLLQYSEDERQHPTCILVKNVFNLITKKKYSGKPTYQSLRQSLEKMKEIAIEKDIKKISMPKIASDLDRLVWSKVEQIVLEVFSDTDIEIVVYYLR